jgi:hypothetical protein
MLSKVLQNLPTLAAAAAYTKQCQMVKLCALKSFAKIERQKNVDCLAGKFELTEREEGDEE